MHRRLRVLALFGALAFSLYAVKPGDTRDQVIAEKGAPAGTIDAGVTQVLNYPTESIKLQDGKVVSVKAVTPPPARPSPNPAAVAATPKPKKPGRPVIPDGAWTIDFRLAVAQAQEQQRKVMLFFTGSDWCGWCKKLEAEVLSTPEFQSYAAAHLILVKLDYPRRTPQPDELIQQNQILMKNYGVRGFPTCILLDPSGARLGELGYQPGGPKPFLETLARL